MEHDPTAELMFELIRLVGDPDCDATRVRELVASIRPEWLETFDETLDKLLLGDEVLWLRLLHRVRGVAIIRNGYRIELYSRLKLLSPFLHVELIFEPFGTHESTAAHIAYRNRFSFVHDEFALVRQRVSGRSVYARLAWIRPRKGSPGFPERDRPIVSVDLSV